MDQAGGGGGTDDQTAAEVTVDASVFTGGILSGTDTDVQEALETINFHDFGDITAVNTEANSGLAGGCAGDDCDLSLDIHNLPTFTGAIADVDLFAIVNMSQGDDPQVAAASTVRTYMQIGAGGGTGDITAVTTANNSGLAGGCSSGECEPTLDLENLDDYLDDLNADSVLAFNDSFSNNKITMAQFATFQADGTTITASNGVFSAVGGGSGGTASEATFKGALASTSTTAAGLRQRVHDYRDC